MTLELLEMLVTLKQVEQMNNWLAETDNRVIRIEHGKRELNCVEIIRIEHERGKGWSKPM